MGKKIIIKGADFSANGIVSTTMLDYVVAKSTTQFMAIKGLVDSATKSLNMRVVANLGFKVDTADIRTFMWGTRPNSDKRFSLTVSSANKIEFNLADVTKTGPTFTINTLHSFDLSKNDFVVDGVSQGSLSPTVSQDFSNFYFGVFGFVSNGGSYSACRVPVGLMFKSCAVYEDCTDDNSKIYDFVPVLKGTKVYFYDTIGDKLYATDDDTNPSYMTMDGVFVE